MVYKFVLPALDSHKNYPEDYADGHNQYVCKCYKCKEHFYGYKRRVICKECLNTEESKTEITFQSNSHIFSVWVYLICLMP